MATRTPRLLSISPVSDGGGSERALVALVAELTSGGWECHVALPGSPRLAGDYVAAGARLHDVPMERLTTSGGALRWFRFAAAWPVSVARLALLARRLDVDVVHSNSLHCWYGWAVARLVGRPHVWHAREIVSQSALALRVERALARRGAKTVVAVSEAVAAQLDRRNVEIVRDDPDPARFRPGAAGRFRHRVGIDDTVLLVGSVARLDTWKGFDTFLDALELVLASRDDVEGLVAGGPVPGKEAYAARLEARAAAMRSVHWVGARDDVAELLADLDVLVQVSQTPEPYGLVVAEALASGTPVVVGDEGGPVEILAGCPADAGRLVPPGDARAVAAAVLELLPSGPSGGAHRQARAVLREPAAGSFLGVMARVVDCGRGPRRTRG